MSTSSAVLFTLTLHIYIVTSACWGNFWPILSTHSAWSMLFPGDLALLWDKTSIAHIRVGWLLKRFFRLCFANLLRGLRCEVWNCFHVSTALVSGEGRDLPVTRGYWCCLQIDFKLISTFFVTDIQQPLHFLDLDIALVRLPMSKRENNFLEHSQRQEQRESSYSSRGFY